MTLLDITEGVGMGGIFRGLMVWKMFCVTADQP